MKEEKEELIVEIGNIEREISSDNIITVNNLEQSVNITEGPPILTLRNAAWKSWIPTLFLAISSIALGIFFLFMRISFLEVHPIISVVLVVNGIILITMASKESYVFDQKQGKLIITKTHWRGKQVQEHWLLQIKEVRVEEYKDPQGGTDYELYLYLRSGQRLKMFNGQIIGVGSTRKLKARDQIKLFLDSFNKKYITRSRASHSEFKGYMKRHLNALNSSINQI